MANRNRLNWALAYSLLAGTCLLTSCGGDTEIPTITSSTTPPSMINSTPTPTPTPTSTRTASISWTPNKEKAVNQAGGGYRVYYSTTQNFTPNGSTYVDVPYVSGIQTPNSANIANLSRGQRYYVKVIAYSALVPTGATAGASSEPSQELTVEVP